jgi:hypothetical protein
MSQKVSDTQLNKAALVIAKLLLRTREGKILWRKTEAQDFWQAFDDGLSPSTRYSADLEEGVRADLSSNEKALGFQLSGPPVRGVVPSPISRSEDVLGTHESERNRILVLFLEHSYDKKERTSPESIVYRDLADLFQLAEDPKSVSDDLRFRQVMSYLDRLAG